MLHVELATWSRLIQMDLDQMTDIWLLEIKRSVRYRLQAFQAQVQFFITINQLTKLLPRSTSNFYYCLSSKTHKARQHTWNTNLEPKIPHIYIFINFFRRELKNSKNMKLKDDERERFPSMNNLLLYVSDAMHGCTRIYYYVDIKGAKRQLG